MSKRKEVTVQIGRKPTVRELQKLYALAWWTAGRDASGVRAVLKNSDVVATAREGKALVGFARASTDFAYRAVLWDVIVHPGRQRLGLGSRLVQAVLGDPRLAQVESFWLFTTDKQPFYRRIGFKGYPKNVMVCRRHVPARP